MHQCQQCEGFIPSQLQACPNCDPMPQGKFSRRLKRTLQLVLGASVTMTLAACYGSPPIQELCDDGSAPPCETQTPTPSPSPSDDANADS